MIAGIFGGLAEYVGMDANIVRLVAVLGLLITGIFPLAIVYIIAMFLVPEKPANHSGAIDGKVE